MALKNNWRDLVDTTDGTDGDDVDAEDINKIAHAVIDNEDNIAINTRNINLNISNKIKTLDESALFDPDTEEYPTTYATMDAIVKQALAVEDTFNDKIFYKEEVANKISEWKDEYSGDEYPTAQLAKNEIDIAKEMAEDGIAQAQTAFVMADQALTEAIAAGDAAETALAGVEGKEDISNKTTEISAESTDTEYPSALAVENRVNKAVEDASADIDSKLENMESTVNKVYVIGEYVNDIEYPTTKAVRDALLTKENVSNKVTSISGSSTDEQYPSAKATNDRIVAKADWEQIEAKTLAENVTEIVLNLPRSYKQLFWVFKVPTINPDKTSSFPKGRMALYSNGNQAVAFDPGYATTDAGNEWYLSYHMQMLGEHCSVFKGFKEVAADIVTSAYIQYPPFYQYATGWQPGKDIGSKGMYYLKLTMMCQTSGARYFPTGTKYELWGVGA